MFAKRAKLLTAIVQIPLTAAMILPPVPAAPTVFNLMQFQRVGKLAAVYYEAVLEPLNNVIVMVSYF